MRRILSISCLTVTLCLLLTVAPYGGMSAVAPRQKVGLLVAASMPLSVSDATVTYPDGRNLSVLAYMVTNRSESQIGDAQMAVYIVGECRCILGAEGWKQRLDLAANSTKSLSITLRHPVPQGRRAVLAVQSVVGAVRTWETSWSDLLKGAKSFAGDGRVVLPAASHTGVASIAPCGSSTVKIVSAFLQQKTWCEARLADAKEACGAGKISSFSCDEKNQTFSFSCKSGDDEMLLN